jgi:hypothetical protein
VLDGPSDTVRMRKARAERKPDASNSLWQKSPRANWVRDVPSEVYFARIRIGGKLFRQGRRI